jgi:hypothetical protein
MYAAYKYFNATLYDNRKKDIPLRIDTPEIKTGQDNAWFKSLLLGELIGFTSPDAGGQEDFDKLANLMANVGERNLFDRTEKPSERQIEAWRRQMNGEIVPVAEPASESPEAVAEPVQYEPEADYAPSPEALPDLRPQIETGVARANGKSEVNRRVVELGQEVAGVKADIHELQQRQTIAGTFEEMFAQIDAMAAEAFGVQRQQAKADSAARDAKSASLRSGLANLGATVLGAAKGRYEQALQNGAGRRQVAPGRAAAVQIGQVRINPDVLAATRVLLAATPGRTAGALPPPRGAQSLHSPMVSIGRRPQLLISAKPEGKK